MLIDIAHVTTYSYDAPVSLGPHTILLRPRNDGSQRIESFSLTLEPDSATQAEGIDLEGNPFTQVWFDGDTSGFKISTRARVETLVTNPFRVAPLPSAQRLDTLYDENMRARLEPYLVEPPVGKAVAGLVEEARRSAAGDTGAFLLHLTRMIHQSARQVFRETGVPRGPEETLTRGEGACRDLAVVFLAACRHAGVAARFVSGYQLKVGTDSGDELHAWAEVYLPGAGWRGYDPTTGLAVADRHVAVAASAQPAGAAPVTGVYFGGVPGRLTTHVDVRRVVDGPSVRSQAGHRP